MPAIWNEDDFVESGFKSIEAFTGSLYEVEEDIDNEKVLDDGTVLSGLQTAFHFEEVEDIVSPEPVKLEGGKFTTWVKQKSTKNSTFHRMFRDWKAFAQKHAIAPLPSGLYGKRIRWERKTYSYGADVNPGRAFVPVAFADEPKRPTRLPVEPEAPMSDSGAGEVSDALAKLILDQVGEDGATKDTIRRAVAKAGVKARNAVQAAGGLDMVLERLVDSLDLNESEGYYTRPDAVNGGDADELPF